MRAYIAMGKYVGLSENSYFAFLRSCNVRFSTFWWIPLILDLTMGLSRVEEVGKHKTYICEWKWRHLNIGLNDNSLLCLCFIQSHRWTTILWCSLEAETPSFLWRNTTLEKGKTNNLMRQPLTNHLSTQLLVDRTFPQDSRCSTAPKFGNWKKVEPD